MRSAINPMTGKLDYYGAADDEILDAKSIDLANIQCGSVNITRGQILYSSNATGSLIIAKPAQANQSGQAAGVLGFASSSLTTGSNGAAICRGVIDSMKTDTDSEGNALSVGDILYLSSSVLGGFTKIPPATPNRRRVGIVLTVNATTGTIFVEVAHAIAQAELLDGGLQSNFDTGFEDPDNVGVSYNRTNRTITLTHSSGIVAWYYRGTRYTATSPWTSNAHTNSTGTYWLTMNGATTTQAWAGSAWTFQDVMVAFVNYDSAAATSTFSLRESHGTMPWQTHQEFHESLGAYWKSGLGLTAGTYVVHTNSTAPSTVADNTPGVDVGTIKDEDLITTIPLLSEGTYTTAYRNGANGDWVFSTVDTTPYFVNTNTIRYNQWTGSTWQLTNLTEDQFVNIFDYAIPVAGDADSQKYRHVWITGQAVFASVTAAQAELPSALSLGSLSSLFAEATCVNRLTYQFNSSGTGSVGAGVSGRCKIMSADPIRGTGKNQVAIIGSTPVLSDAASISLNTSTFDKNLSPAITNVQLLAEVVDELATPSRKLATSSLAIRAISTWTSRTSASDNNWYAVCWSSELGLFCAVSASGTGNRVMTSPDGITWTSRTSASNNNWVAVCWSPELGLFCAVSGTGTGNRVMTSPDGINWTIRTSAADYVWQSVCWSPELGLLCAVAISGSGNRVMTSPDGITWTSRTSASDNNWVAVCWSPELGLFCAVAASGTGNRVMTSPDGINWTSRTSAVDNDWYAVCWSSELGLFCAVAYTGSGNRVMTSPDGINWTSRTSASDNNWISVCWSPELGLFCAVAASGTGNRVMTSPDGINWTSRTSAVDNDWQGACWSPALGLFCAVANSGTGNRVMTSKDIGVYAPRKVVPKYFFRAAQASEALRVVKKWYPRTSASTNDWLSICWSSELGLFCAVSGTGTGNRVMTSPDGITWTSRTSASDNNWRSVCWSPELGLFCAVSASGTGNRVMTSPDGITWTSKTSAADNEWFCVCWSPELGLFCTLSQSGTGNRVMTSPDGDTWTIRTSAADNIWSSICWSPELGLFCAVSTGGTDRVMTSPDGITWTSRSAAAANSWVSVCWSPELGLFCAVAYTGTGNRVMTSPNGITWTSRTSAADNQWYSVCWSPELGLFCATSLTGTGNRVMTSPDGINWTLRTSAADNTWYSVCWSPDLGIFCAVAYSAGSRVMTSKKMGLLSEMLNLKTSRLYM